MKLILGTLLLGASFAIGADVTTALAQGSDEQRGACMGDAFRLCGSFVPDEAAIEKCLESQLPNLAPACRAQFTSPTPPPPKGRKAR